MTSATRNYQSFLNKKLEDIAPSGFKESEIELGSELFPHQIDLVRWALMRGRSAIFADTGLGKTIMQLEWARNVAKHGRVLILTPLAVAPQTVDEGERFGIDCEYARHDTGAQITVTNYEMLGKFDASRFIGVVLDESSILKSLTGKTRTALIETFKRTPYRLACTATPAPNDHTELGNHSEFLGVKTMPEMLAEYFINDAGGTGDWRLKGHARSRFWQWLATWGAVIKKPSDLGHDDRLFDLPDLCIEHHVVGVDHRIAWVNGSLFATDAATLSDQRKVRRESTANRVERAATLADNGRPVVVWCELNDEANQAEKLIDGAVQVAGSDNLDDKERKLRGFATGEHRVIVTKPSIAGFGLNWQHCNTMIFVGASHSYEATYQAIRRCWRFGQKKPVHTHMIATEADGNVIRNYQQKDKKAQEMGREMTKIASAALRDQIQKAPKRHNEYKPKSAIKMPEWI